MSVKFSKQRQSETKDDTLQLLQQQNGKHDHDGVSWTHNQHQNVADDEFRQQIKEVPSIRRELFESVKTWKQ